MTVEIPARLEPEVARTLAEAGARAFGSLGVTGYGLFAHILYCGGGTSESRYSIVGARVAKSV